MKRKNWKKISLSFLITGILISQTGISAGEFFTSSDDVAVDENFPIENIDDFTSGNTEDLIDERIDYHDVSDENADQIIQESFDSEAGEIIDQVVVNQDTAPEDLINNTYISINDNSDYKKVCGQLF